MIDNISFNYFTDDFEHLQTICSKMCEYSTGSDFYYFSPRTKANVLYPIHIRYYKSNKVVVSGSIHKFWNKLDNCNDNNFSMSDAVRALENICEILKIDLSANSIIITSIEIGLNLKISIPVVDFLKSVGKYKFKDFSYTKPKSGTVKKWGKELRTSDFDIKFYDKSYLTNKQLKYTKYHKLNLLRFEISYNHHPGRYLKFNTINDLVKNHDSIKIMLFKTIDNITFNRAFDYKTLTTKEILICEGYQSQDFQKNTKHLLRKTKKDFDILYSKISKKHLEYDYSKTIHIRLKRKIRYLCEYTFPSL